MRLTLKGLAQALDSGIITGDAHILVHTTADQVTGWLYQDGAYADAGDYEVLSQDMATAVIRWRDGGPSPFADERLGLCVWTAMHILWKAEQDFLSGSA